ncbi:hypothetical protein M513_12993 [Trichuris suis]|uniref:Uncharacterized protein n=1 Tax=Trichuris suis TaxID=68888 RepID=A0A085LMD1_9BILA|nr:hypothetical protein M513_12993 [Trichuris suis]
MHRILGLRGLNWDDEIPADQEKWWQQRIERLGDLELLSIPRSLCTSRRHVNYIRSTTHHKRRLRRPPTSGMSTATAT